MTIPEQFQVNSKQAGSRVDLFLKDRVETLSRKGAKRLLDQGRIWINGRKVVIASWELKAGDQVEIRKDSSTEQPADDYFLKVHYEDDDLLVVEKDSGIPCEETPLSLKPSLIVLVNNYLKKQLPGMKGVYVGLMHRLDTETSGLMVYTKSKEANQLADQFKQHTIQRQYQTIVWGRIEKEQGIIKVPLIKCDGNKGQKMQVGRAGKGQKAETRYRVLERYADATLLEITVATGRTHQIRVHLAHLGHPIVGDKIYGDPSQKSGIKRQALHATLLGFQHPTSGERLSLKSLLPRDMRRLLERLRRSS